MQEYALAAYNAGDSRVVDWEAAGPYHGMDEFVESIPFTQTREYVEAILRNEETYRAIDEFAATQSTDGHRGRPAKGRRIASDNAGIPFDTTVIRFGLTWRGCPRQHCNFNRRLSSFRDAIRSLLLFDKGPAPKHRTRLGYINPLEGTMSADLQFLEEWIPERMDPGTVFVLENQAKLGHAQNPFVAVMSCPRCGTLGLITRRQLYAGRNDDLRGRRVFGRVQAGWGKHLLSQGTVAGID